MADGLGVLERLRSADAHLPTRDQGGTGLGLPIARRIVEQHGGSIELDSPPEEGTTAAVRLPILA